MLLNFIKNRTNGVVLASAVIFFLAVLMGFYIAKNKPVWTDEAYSQLGEINTRSIIDMFQGRITEGNTCPLFYVIQKTTGVILGQQFTQDNIHSAQTRIILRIQPVFFMALTIACIFFYFSRFYSLRLGFYSLFLSLSSFMVWTYWAEARPYALWCFLTTSQMLLFLHIASRKDQSKRLFWTVALINILLSLTVVFSMGQVALVSALLFIIGYRDLRKYIVCTILPIGIAFFYYTCAPKYNFNFGTLDSEQLIRECFSRDRFYILFIYMVFIGIYMSFKKLRHKLVSQEVLKALYCMLYVLGSLAFSFVVMYIFVLKDAHGPKGFVISSRYFIFLTPVSIISSTYLSYIVLKSIKLLPVRIAVGSGILCLIIKRLLKVWPVIKRFCVFLN